MNDYVEKFWSQVDKLGACWRWTGNISLKGYAVFYANHDGLKFWKAHRFSWHINNGPIPKGLQVLHKCDNPWCTNPEHLWLGTNADNHADKLAKGRQSKGRVVNTCKLTEDQVLEIRATDDTYEALGRKYGVYGTTIAKIKERRSWKHI